MTGENVYGRRKNIFRFRDMKFEGRDVSSDREADRRYI